MAWASALLAALLRPLRVGVVDRLEGELARLRDVRPIGHHRAPAGMNVVGGDVVAGLQHHRHADVGPELAEVGQRRDVFGFPSRTAPASASAKGATSIVVLAGTIAGGTIRG